MPAFFLGNVCFFKKRMHSPTGERDPIFHIQRGRLHIMHMHSMLETPYSMLETPYLASPDEHSMLNIQYSMLNFRPKFFKNQ